MEDRHLCKAKRKDNEEWVEGYIAHCPTGEWEILDIEVIGNIFDNPELLEAGKEAGEQGSQDVLMPAT